MSQVPEDPDLLPQISEVSRCVSALFDAHLRSMDLTAARARALLFLWRQRGPQGQAAVTEFLRVEGPTAVRILDGLESLGMIRRLPDPLDRRAKLIELTGAGRQQGEQVAQLTRRITAALLQDVSADQMSCARTVLASILHNGERAHGTLAEPAEREALPA